MGLRSKRSYGFNENEHKKSEGVIIDEHNEKYKVWFSISIITILIGVALFFL